MTIDTSSLAAAQARVTQIQSLFGTPGGPSTAAVGATSPNAGAFRDAMTRAQGSTGNAAGPASTSSTSSGARNGAGSRASTSTLTAPTPTARTSSPQRAATGHTERTAPTPTRASSGIKDADAVLATAKKYLGIPYKWGGTNPRTGLDCSGFVQLVMKQHGVSLPRVSRDQARQGVKVPSLAQARPGDLVAFGNPVHHIGIYVGGGKMIHAPHTGDVVKISKVHKDLTAIRRILPEQPSAAPIETIPAAGADRTARATRSAALASAPLPAAGVNTTKLASSLRAAAVSPTAVDSATWQEVVADAVRDSLVGSDVENTQAVVQTALAGLGPATTTSSTTMLDAASRAAAANATLAAAGAGAATDAAPRAARTSLAPDARGTQALDQAPARLQTLFRDAERKYGVPATLLAAVAKQESGFKTTAVSHAGAQGLMQLMPGTARGLGVRNSFDPAQAVDGAARLLRSHLRTFESTELALAAYNAGAGAVRKYDGIPPYAETRNYVRRIMAGLGTSA
ncbi:transglycosylase SLT domain-containing protein [Mobilicoccus pelagius]|uniref:NlpC/P60 domain-containing protein n=1 Tax=Mobilicoccus pelagius NBRC 104925 TaxID=1089455 RepID=H5UP75_9MICO|nr:transglycosylase SLT domain-containing protein [Mobilicoccus pelagius]GAB47533.1 hypothetical protein MOPEL_020_00190 [Mobilicoccus pelagius NBRC 104925]